jgi:integrase
VLSSDPAAVNRHRMPSNKRSRIRKQPDHALRYLPRACPSGQLVRPQCTTARWCGRYRCSFRSGLLTGRRVRFLSLSYIDDRWAQQSKRLRTNIALDLKPVRTVRNTRPVGLTEPEVHTLLRLAGESGHGLAKRNYALVQLMIQTGLRVGEMAALRVADITAHERSGLVRIGQGKGLKAREVPLNATAQRALRLYLDNRNVAGVEEPLFLIERGGPMPTRTIQADRTSSTAGED